MNLHELIFFFFKRRFCLSSWILQMLARPIKLTLHLSFFSLCGLTCLGSPCGLCSLWTLWFFCPTIIPWVVLNSFGEGGRVITFCFESELQMGFCQCYCCCSSECNSSDASSPCTPVGLEDRPVGAVVDRGWDGEWAVVCNWRWRWFHDGEGMHSSPLIHKHK